mmetsp:Transcript_27611/g.64358  ORF Transcript_27611/g.64358 Transcript_27611/m.64358 type:complete len:250 (+) Transcript_27611:76-825(+)
MMAGTCRLECGGPMPRSWPPAQNGSLRKPLLPSPLLKSLETRRHASAHVLGRWHGIRKVEHINVCIMERQELLRRLVREPARIVWPVVIWAQQLVVVGDHKGSAHAHDARGVDGHDGPEGRLVDDAQPGVCPLVGLGLAIRNEGFVHDAQGRIYLPRRVWLRRSSQGFCSCWALCDPRLEQPEVLEPVRMSTPQPLVEIAAVSFGADARAGLHVHGETEDGCGGVDNIDDTKENVHVAVGRSSNQRSRQ